MKKILFLSLISLLSSCSIFKANKTVSKKNTILIIGAGISGLSAANYLKKKGYQPIVLEAQSEVGGRLKTNRSLGVAFDQGASWIHGPNKNPITKLAKKSGTKTLLTDDSSVKVYDVDGLEYSPDQLEEAEDQYEDILDRLKGKKQKSFADVFYKAYPQYKNQRLWTYMLSAYLEFDTGGDIYQLSSKDFYDDKEFKGEDVMVTNGFDQIANHLAKKIDVRLNTKVTGINYSGNQVRVTTDNGNYTSDLVLVTVPLGVLKRGVIQFSPKLPEDTQGAIDQLEMGTVNKFLLVWEQAFWEEELQHIGYTAEEKGKFNYFLNLKKVTGDPALVTFAFGDFSKTTEQRSDEEIQAAIMAHLRRIYGKEIPDPLNMLRTKWNENPYTYGAYSFATNGIRSEAFKVFEQPINDKVFFAGEHTIRDYRGTVHGAYLSGIREAKKIMKIK